MHTACLAAKIKCLAESNNIRIGTKALTGVCTRHPPVRSRGRVGSFPRWRGSTSQNRQKESKAMWIKSSLLALGFAGAMVASTPAPAPAQGVYVGPHGVGLTLVVPATVSIIAGITIMAMTVGVGAAGR